MGLTSTLTSTHHHIHLDENMSGTNKSAALEIVPVHVIHPDRDDLFRAAACPTDLLKRNVKTMGVQCTQCQKKLDKLLKCSKCKGVWYCSKECQKKHWPIHKLGCHDVERSSGAIKLVRMITANITLMMCLQAASVIECALLENPRIGFDMPFMVRVDIAVEPVDILDFIRLYLDGGTVQEKIQGMVQVNTISPWVPSAHGPLTPTRLRLWREARAEGNAKGFSKDPIGLIEFINYTEHGTTSAFRIPPDPIRLVKKGEPFISSSAFTGNQIEKPLNSATLLEYINLHIRADKQNQLLLRTEMTEQDKEVIRATGRNEESLSVTLLKDKMRREHLYANIVNLTANQS
ncbi:uncharacterized protein EDB91DRAFT_1118111 [Suillus paluster]|uniref:uncharacterized protein n=1 Tax=Suillus paluster TaxID=48578 RepID=UPI001B85BD0B|nr:uncharacterized protein EDB91DRAFT_1118111 [Suillus paluster]KAG1746641.1 hypothetical protein EDB91DRAFT_1118111 [Suillus paluster]